MPDNRSAILEMLGCIYEDLDMDSVEKKFVDLVNSTFVFDRVALFFVKHKKEVLCGKLARGFKPKAVKSLEIPIGGDFALTMPLVTGMPLRIKHASADKYSSALGLRNSVLIPVVSKKCIACWEIKNCKAHDCPAYGNKWLRCWLVAGTKCSSGKNLALDEKARMCSECRIFSDHKIDAVEGVLLIDNSVSNKPISEHTVTLLSILSYAVGVAVNNSKLYMKTRDIAIRDDLTGLHNRRYFNERLLDEVDRSTRYGETFSLLMCDIDHFKLVNDNYGHPFGDSILCQVGEILQNNLRKTDLMARYRGEEFAILLLNSEKKTALRIAEKLRHTIEKNLFSRFNTSIKITLSFGVATLGVDSGTFEGLLSKVDACLYSAKSQGRNKVCG